MVAGVLRGHLTCSECEWATVAPVVEETAPTPAKEAEGETVAWLFGRDSQDAQDATGTITAAGVAEPTGLGLGSAASDRKSASKSASKSPPASTAPKFGSLFDDNSFDIAPVPVQSQSNAELLGNASLLQRKPPKMPVADDVGGLFGPNGTAATSGAASRGGNDPLLGSLLDQLPTKKPTDTQHLFDV